MRGYLIDVCSLSLCMHSDLMYLHRGKRDFHVIDLDPYGTASIFIDPAVQSVSNGGTFIPMLRRFKLFSRTFMRYLYRSTNFGWWTTPGILFY